MEPAISAVVTIAATSHIAARKPKNARTVAVFRLSAEFHFAQLPVWEA